MNLCEWLFKVFVTQFTSEEWKRYTGRLYWGSLLSSLEHLFRDFGFWGILPNGDLYFLQIHAGGVSLSLKNYPNPKIGRRETNTLECPSGFWILMNNLSLLLPFFIISSFSILLSPGTLTSCFCWSSCDQKLAFHRNPWPTGDLFITLHLQLDKILDSVPATVATLFYFHLLPCSLF